MPDHQHNPEPTLGEVVETSDGSLTLSHPEHGECYHTRAGALAEVEQLYLEASGLASLWRTSPAPVSVLDVGLGLGYTAAITLAAWYHAPAPGPLALTSLEVNPALVPALASGQAPWQANWPPEQLAFCRALTQTAANQWCGTIPHPRAATTAIWQIDVADASHTAIPASALPGGYTYIWQDPFSPGKNPPLWQAEWFTRLRAVAAANCQLMTYSVATHVRAALEASGWSWAKIPTTLPSKRKRHWLKAEPLPYSKLANTI